MSVERPTKKQVCQIKLPCITLGKVIVVGLLLASLACGEQRREHFVSGAEALASETARRGWIPAWLPQDAKRIDVLYDLDTNDTWLSFGLSPSAVLSLQQQLRQLSEQEIQTLSLRNPRASSAWPEGLIQQQPANDGALVSRVFCGAGQTVPTQACFAFENGTDNVYVWILRDER